MTNTVLLKRSNTANAVPLAGNLTAGELALNYTDGNLFYKNNAGVVTLLASNQQMSVIGNITGGNLITGGLVTATGNITGGNLLTAGIVSATGNITGKYFLGNANIQYTASTAPTTGNLIGAQWYNTSTDTLYEWQTDGTNNYWVDVTGPVVGVTGGATGNVIVNGTSNVTIPVANGNAGINIGGTANIAIFATTGEYVTGVVSATGNITGGNITTAGQLVSTVATGTAPFVISSTTKVSGLNVEQVDGFDASQTATANTIVVRDANANINTVVLSASGNVTGGNIITGGQVSATGNVQGGNLVLTTGNLTFGNVNMNTSNSVIQGWSYAGISKSIATEELTSYGMFVGNAGSSFYVVGTTNDRVYQYNMSSTNMANTGVLFGNVSVTTQDATPNDLFIDSTGANMYVLGQTNRVVFQYTLSTPWNVTTASYATLSANVAAQETVPTGVWFKPDLTTMYVVGTTSSTVFQYTLATPGNIATATYASKSVSVSTATTPQAVNLSSDGTKMWIVSSSNSAIYEYNLGTAWDVSTATYALGNNYSVRLQETTPTGLYVDLANTKFWVNGTTSDTVFQYNTANSIIAQANSVGIQGQFGVQGNAYFGQQTVFVAQVGMENTLTVDSTITGAAGITFSTTTSAISIGTSQTTGTFQIGGTAQTSNIGIGRSANTSAIVIGNGVMQSGNTKTIDIGTLGAANSLTNINFGPTAGNGQVSFLSNAQVSIANTGGLALSVAGNVTGGNILTAGIISATGNLTVGNLTTTIANVTTFNSSQGGNVTGTLVATSANAQFINQTNGAGYATVAGYLSVAGNVTGGNILTGGVVSATGNITATANISGGNILTAGLMSSTGNITAGNISTAGLITATGNITAVANVAGGNILTAGITSSTGNVIGGNIVTGGLITATGNIVAAANITGGNILTSGIMSSTGNAAHGNLTVTGFGTITYAPASVTGYALQLNAANTVGGTSYGDFLRATNTSGGATSPNKSFRINNIGTLELLNSAYTSVLLSVSDTGALTVGGSTGTLSLGAAATANNDPTTNYIGFNSNNSVIYDDGNFHLHARGNGNNMWLNAGNAAIILGNQNTISGGLPATGVVMGSSATVKAYCSIYGSKSYAISGYGYLSTGGAGTVGGSSGSVPYSLYCDNRIQASEIDATSDERAKNIQGTIPLEQALKFVRAVDGILYTWDLDAVEHEDTGLKAGFGAQAVHKAGFDHMIGVIPNDKMKEKVDEDGWVHPEGYQLTMGYNQAVPYHHEVIKHLLDRIEQLEATVAKLTNK